MYLLLIKPTQVLVSSFPRDEKINIVMPYYYWETAVKKSGMLPTRLALPTARAWAQSGRWEPAALRGALGDAILTVKQAEARHFMYTASGREGELLTDTTITGSMPMAANDFFAAIEADSGPPFLYCTALVKDLDAQGEGWAPGWEALATGATEATGDDDAACRPWLQFWAGTEGACTQAHYDVADNAFVQVSGRKEFLLYPPSAATALHLYPDAHPRARKAQVCIEDPDLSIHPLAADLPNPLRVVLDPGESLFLPAFWMHHVTALTPSVSLNVFSESPVKLAASEALQLPPPLHASWDAPLKRRGLLLLLQVLLHELRLSGGPLLARLVESRFTPLLRAVGSSRDDGPSTPLSSAATGAGPSTATGRRRRRRSQVIPAPSWAELAPLVTGHAQICARSLTRLRTAVDCASAHHATRWTAWAAPPVRAQCSAELPLTNPSGAVDEYHNAVLEITLMHLVELWTLRLFGPDRLAAELLGLSDEMRSVR